LKRKNGLYQVHLDPQNYNKVQEEEKGGKNKKAAAAAAAKSNTTNQEQQHYTRFVLNVHDNISRDSDEEENVANGYISQNANINKGNEDIQGNAKQLAHHIDKAAK